MSSQDLKTMQRDAFAAIQQLIAQSPSVAALQMQLTQGQLRADGSPGEERLPTAIGEQYLVFALAEREFAVKAELVQVVERLVELTPVPNIAPWVRGVINQRGSIVSVVDLRMFLDLEVLPYSSQNRLLSLQCNEMMICLVVDGVNEMLSVPSNAIVGGNVRQANIPSWAVPYATGSVLLGNRVMVILDVPRLLFSEKMQHYTA